MAAASFEREGENRRKEPESEVRKCHFKNGDLQFLEIEINKRVQKATNGSRKRQVPNE